MYPITKGHRPPVPELAPERTKRDSNAIGGVYKGSETVNDKTGKTVIFLVKVIER